MKRYKFLAFSLIVAVVSLGLYLPVYNTSKCTCRSKYETCQIDHSCLNCSPNKAHGGQKSTEKMCHLASEKGKNHCSNFSKNRKIVKIFNPGCGAGESVSYTSGAREPFIVSKEYNFHQYFSKISFNANSPKKPEKIFIVLPDKPPQESALLA